MIIRGLYESLKACLNEARTIDNKLWLSIASTCSRNRSTEAEFIKPLLRQTKDELLKRYVAALIIMKKPCPNNEQDIDNIKTFKLIGKRLIELGCTFLEIKNEYIANGGKITNTTNTTNTTVTPTLTEVKQLETEIKQEIKQVQQEQIPSLEEKQEALQEIKKELKKLPDGIKSYDEMFSYVNDEYKNDITKICEKIYEILDTTYFNIKKTFYKITRNDYTLYFKDVYTDDDLKVYHNDKHIIYITYVKVKGTRIIEDTFGILVNNMTIKEFPVNKHRNIIGDSITLNIDELTDMCKNILSKLLYAMQLKYNNPLLGNKVISTTWGNFNNKHRSFNEPIDNDIYSKILQKVIKQYPSTNKCQKIILELLLKQKLGNEADGLDFIYKEPLYSEKFILPSGKEFHVLGISTSHNGFYVNFIHDGKPLTIYSSLWTWTDANTGVSDISWAYKGYKLTTKLIKPAYWCCIAAILYYANNYENLLNI